MHDWPSWLTLDPAKADAAEAALSLYPEADTSPLLKLYETQETLRPRLMRLFRKQIKILPQAVLQGAASDESSSAELKIEALHYAAAHPDIGLDLFRNHYVPLLSGTSQCDANLIATALWGGLVRGDAEAHPALAAAIGHTSNAQGLAAAWGDCDWRAGAGFVTGSACGFGGGDSPATRYLQPLQLQAQAAAARVHRRWRGDGRLWQRAARLPAH